jgi:hypothetical protein
MLLVKYSCFTCTRCPLMVVFPACNSENGRPFAKATTPVVWKSRISTKPALTPGAPSLRGWFMQGWVLGFPLPVSRSQFSIFQFRFSLQSGQRSRTVLFLSISTVAIIFTESYHLPDFAVDDLRARTFSISRASKGPPCPPPHSRLFPIPLRISALRNSETLSSRPEWPIFSLRSRRANVGHGVEGPWQHV